MTNGELRNYLTGQATLLGMEGSVIESVVDGAIDVGLKEFWRSKAWSFRHKAATLTISSEAESYDLPDDFGGALGFREKETLSGFKLKYREYSHFIMMFPYPTSHTRGYPEFYTVYRDRNDNHTWKARFFPVPEDMTIYVDYLSDSITNVEEVPDAYGPGLVEVCLKYLIAPGTEARMLQQQIAWDTLDRLENEDDPFHESIVRFEDDTDQTVRTERPWVD